MPAVKTKQPQPKPEQPKTAPRFDFDLAPDRDYVKKGGKLYEIRRLDDFGIGKQRRLDRDGREFAQLWNSSEDFDDDSDSGQRLDFLLNRIFDDLLDAPDEVRDEFADAAKAKVVLDFSLAPLRELLAENLRQAMQRTRSRGIRRRPRRPDSPASLHSWAAPAPVGGLAGGPDEDARDVCTSAAAVAGGAAVAQVNAVKLGFADSSDPEVRSHLRDLELAASGGRQQPGVKPTLASFAALGIPVEEVRVRREVRYDRRTLARQNSNLAADLRPLEADLRDAKTRVALAVGEMQKMLDSFHADVSLKAAAIEAAAGKIASAPGAGSNITNVTGGRNEIWGVRGPEHPGSLQNPIAQVLLAGKYFPLGSYAAGVADQNASDVQGSKNQPSGLVTAAEIGALTSAIHDLAQNAAPGSRMAAAGAAGLGEPNPRARPDCLGGSG